MIIDVHACPGDMSPEAFARACHDAGLDAVVVADNCRTDRLDAFIDALGEADVLGFAGVRLPLERGALVAIPRVDDDAFRRAKWDGPWSAEDAAQRLADFDGLVIISHPYDRGDGPPMGDRVYRLAKIAGAIETKIGRGEMRWDAMADSAAQSRGLSRLGTSSGDPKRLGVAATIVPGIPETEAELVEALTALTLVVEFDDPAAPRDRTVPEPAPREDRGPRGDRERGRGGRRDDRRGGRGDRGDRRGGRDGDRRGGRGRGRRGDR